MLLGFLACVVGCQAKEADTSKTKRPPPRVTVSTVVLRDVPIEVEAPVDLKPLEQVEVGSKVVGYLDAVLVERGDRVRKGQPIALVRPSDLPDQVAAARSSYAQVESSALLARANYERATKLKPAGVLSDQELEQSKTALLASEAAQAASKAQLEALAVRLGETRITSPIDGLVALRRLDPGALVGPTTSSGFIATIMRVDRLRAFITVVERYATSVVVGMPARITLDATAGEPYTGAVVRVSPAVDPNTRTLEAEVQIPNPEGRLRPGMYGRGYIQIGLHERTTVVPINAVQFSSQGTQVFRVTGDTVTLKAVTVGAEVDRGAAIEVLTGLSPGERVVTAGIDGLASGTKVTVVDAKASEPRTTQPAATTPGATPSALPSTPSQPSSLQGALKR